LVAGPSPVGTLLAVLALFVLAVGAGIVLVSVIARGIQTAENSLHSFSCSHFLHPSLASLAQDSENGTAEA
jgi:predicted PurR-regulated permease PerM